MIQNYATDIGRLSGRRLKQFPAVASLLMTVIECDAILHACAQGFNKQILGGYKAPLQVHLHHLLDVIVI